MKALTICQPYAHLIIHGAPMPDGRRAFKLVENRKWSTRHRGPMFIHAGMSRDWLTPVVHAGRSVDAEYRIPIEEMQFGAVIGIAHVVDCVWHDEAWKASRAGDAIRRRFPWFQSHEHAEGPWCWILERARAIEPVRWKGALGLFEIDEAELARQAAQPQGREGLWS